MFLSASLFADGVQNLLTMIKTTQIWSNANTQAAHRSCLLNCVSEAGKVKQGFLFFQVEKWMVIFV